MNPGIAYALLAAALFGASTPFAKRLVGDVPPLMLAGLLYLGSGFGLSLMLGLRKIFTRGELAIAWPVMADWGWLAGAIFFGWFLGPVLLMYGLAASSAATASLLLNFESVFTALVACPSSARILTGALRLACCSSLPARSRCRGRQTPWTSRAARCWSWGVRVLGHR